MPGWPSVGRADEQRLTESLRRADAAAASGLCEAYADRLHDYAASLLGDGEAAAEAVHDAMVTALTRANRLTRPARLRAWLYALTRYHCLVRPRPPRPSARVPRPAAPAAGPLDAPTAPWPVAAPEATRAFPAGHPVGRATEPLPPGLAAAPDDPAPDADPELAALVHQALGELDRPEREVLELTARHGLGPAETSAVVGATSRQTAARLAHARDHLENAAAAVVLARTGRAHCPDLSAMLDSWEGPLSEPLRKRLARHIAACEVCAEGRGRRVSAERLLDVFPIRYAPLSLRRRVVDTCVNPGRAAARAALVPEAGHFGRDGFPIMPDRRRGARAGRTGRAGRGSARPSAIRRPRRAVTAVATLACLGAVTGILIAAAGLDGGRSGGRAALMPPAPSPSADPGGPETGPADGPGEDEVIGPGPADPGGDAPERTPLARPSATPRPAGTTPPATRPASRPPSPRTTRPAAALLAVSCPAALGANRAGVIRITARNAPITWSAGTTGDLVLSPARGRLRAGASARLAVGADGTGPGSGVIRFESNGGTRTCRVTWAGESPPSRSAPPAEPGDASPEPSPSPSDGGPADDGSGEALVSEANPSAD